MITTRWIFFSLYIGSILSVGYASYISDNLLFSNNFRLFDTHVRIKTSRGTFISIEKNVLKESKEEKSLQTLWEQHTYNQGKSYGFKSGYGTWLSIQKATEGQTLNLAIDEPTETWQIHKKIGGDKVSLYQKTEKKYLSSPKEGEFSLVDEAANGTQTTEFTMVYDYARSMPDNKE